MQARPPEITEKPVPARAAAPPASMSPSRGPPATTTMKTPESRPCMPSGTACCSIVERNTALIVSEAPATARKKRPSDQGGGEAEQRDGGAPGQDRPDDGDALLVHPAHPAAGERGQQRTDRGRRVQPARCADAAVEVVGREGWEQCPWHAEDHRHDVERERHEDHVPATQEGQALEDRAQAGLAGALGRWQGRQPEVDGEEGDHEGREVEGVRRSEAQAAGQRAGEQRAHDDAEVEQREEQVVGCGELLRPDKLGHHGAAGRRVEGEERGLHGDTDVEQPRPGAVRRGPGRSGSR